MKITHITRRLGKGAAVFALAGALSVVGAGTAFATSASQVASSSEPITVDTNLLTSLGARAGSAGPDFLGVSGMNYDFQKSHTKYNNAYLDPYPYYDATNDAGYSKDLTNADQFNRLAIWGSGVNEYANPYYQNLLVNYLDGNTLSSEYTKATTYHVNNNTGSWGDVTNNGTSVITSTYKPDIIFGANKYTNWHQDYSAGTKAAAAVESAGYNPTWTNNDSTNIYTQIYSMEQLASSVDSVTSSSAKYTRYDSSNASVSALNYEKATKGQLLYCASKLSTDSTVKKKTVAYLYAINGDTAYFFTPTADGLITGDDAGDDVGGTTKGSAKKGAHATTYASNNSTINMGYMAYLPYITNTFQGGTKLESGIEMSVEDIVKVNPAVTLTKSTTDALKDVDIIIYNSTKETNLDGTSGGKNNSGINNSEALTDANVTAWAATCGFAGSVLAGDDYGTSTNQSTDVAVGATTGSAPMLYCSRNYTFDKNSRAAWAFSKVYPDFYGGNDDASYAYWLEEIYHIQNAQVNNVLAQYTHQSESTVNVFANNSSTLDHYAEIGKKWWEASGKTSDAYKAYAYYNGSSRASYYADGSTYSQTESAEPVNTIGIFAPSTLWNNTPSTYTLGDVNNNGSINIIDAQVDLDLSNNVYGTSYEKFPIEGWSEATTLAAGDVNTDKVINALDVRGIQTYVHHGQFF